MVDFAVGGAGDAGVDVGRAAASEQEHPGSRWLGVSADVDRPSSITSRMKLTMASMDMRAALVVLEGMQS